MRRVFAIFEKDFRNGFRNWEVLFIILMPLLISVFTNIALSSKNMPLPKIALFSPNNKLKNALLGIMDYKEVKVCKTWDEAVSLVEKGEVQGAISVPESLEPMSKTKHKPEIKIVLDEASPEKTLVIQTGIKGFIESHFELSSPVILTLKKLRGISPKQRMLHIWLLLPILMIGCSCIPLIMGEEKDKKTLNAVLLTPTSVHEVIFAKIIWGCFLIVISVIVLLFLNDGFIGNNLLLTVVILLGTLSLAGIGLFIGIIAPTQTTASLGGAFAMIILLNSAMLGMISDTVNKVSWFLPGNQIIEGIRKALFFKSNFIQGWDNILLLLIWTILFFVIDASILKRYSGRL